MDACHLDGVTQCEKVRACDLCGTEEDEWQQYWLGSDIKAFDHIFFLPTLTGASAKVAGLVVAFGLILSNNLY